MTNEIYISVDVETDGPIPGKHSLLSLGAAAFSVGDGLLDTFAINLHPLPDAAPDRETLKWWKTQPEAWEAATRNPEYPTIAMPRFVEWVKQQPGKPVFVGYPTGFDFTFVYWYLVAYTGASPFSFSALDIKTYACALMKKPFRECHKKTMPKEWLAKRPHTHDALDDALEQGELFMNMLRSNLRQRYVK